MSSSQMSESGFGAVGAGAGAGCWLAGELPRTGLPRELAPKPASDERGGARVGDGLPAPLRAPASPRPRAPPPSPLVPWLEVRGCALGINYERLEHDPILSAGSGVLPLQQTTTNNNKHTHDCSLVGWIDRPSSQACLLVLSV